MEADIEAVVRRLDKTLHLFLEQNPALTVAALSTFVALALREGIGPTEIGKAIGVPTSTVSRHLLDMSVRDRQGRPGLAWIERGSSDHSLRELKYTVSPKGQSLLKKLRDIWS